MDGDLVRLFARMIIARRRAGRDAPEAADFSAAGQHRLAEHGFAAGGVADYSEVAQFRGGILLHR